MTIKMQWMAMLVLACSVSVVAQSNMSSDSSMKKSDAMGKKMTMSGCVSEKDGKYMLMDKKHPDGVELMSSEDLKPHVGHTVSVTGMMENHDAMSGDAMSNDSMKKDDMKKDDMSKDHMAMSGFKVNKMKMVSEHCSMPDSMMNK
jgi:hypothetical protein